MPNLCPILQADHPSIVSGWQGFQRAKLDWFSKSADKRDLQLEIRPVLRVSAVLIPARWSPCPLVRVSRLQRSLAALERRKRRFAVATSRRSQCTVRLCRQCNVVKSLEVSSDRLRGDSAPAWSYICAASIKVEFLVTLTRSVVVKEANTMTRVADHQSCSKSGEVGRNGKDRIEIRLADEMVPG